MEPSKTRKQKTAPKAGALVDDPRLWKSIDWPAVRRNVRRLQMRIAKAVSDSRYNKAKALQYMLTRSFYAKLLAVKRVTSNKGKNTPGVDGVRWKGARAKMQAVTRLQRRGYRPQPLRRIYIPKKNGKQRPLSIPTMYDRAMQALYKLALAPIAETTADRNSYGFREGRSCADAIAAVFNALAKPNSATWILEADIEGCFDNISFDWMLQKIPTDREILRKWLNSGYVENGITYPSHKGTPQGGIISPTLSNMTLDGLEQAVLNAVPRRSRVNFIRYADDFIVTAKSKQLLETKVKPVIEAFLKKRGLKLSPEKTKITFIRDGFEFLGQSIRKHGQVLHITPSEEGVLALFRKIGNITRQYVSAPIEVLIGKLNATLRGWANYHRHVVSSETFRRVDTYVFHQLWRMLRRRHQNKSKRWLIKRYWSATGRLHVFSATKKCKDVQRLFHVLRVCSIGIKRHIKVKADANPYQSEYSQYFWNRRHHKEMRQLNGLSARLHRAMAT